MPGHRISSTVRRKLQAGLKVTLRRGWRRGDPPTSASPVRRIDPQTGAVLNVSHVLTAAPLKPARPRFGQLWLRPRSPS